ncbi:MAG: precorrin-6y C5,15-methyltransferase (decarboxylating) subunit CbiE [bacterium]|nr:precorrin-6y C5,15-methyltransferase (decarboxylating) subunit CbiE [bacterium]MDE0240004.1 precorrin-6y C5,15-methyltransferase (decarboxylating) subunit CbiE [bacterium]
MAPWLVVVGLGEDGPDGLPGSARALIDGAEVLVGGRRHLAMVDAGARPALAWESPLSRTVEAIAAYEGHRVCVLATGDPMHYGIGVTLARRFGREALVVLPAPSAFSLACARLAWPLAETVQLTLHGRPPELVRAHLVPGQKMLALSHDATTPPTVCRLLCEAGYGASEVHVLCHLGGARERVLSGTAETLVDCQADDLNTLAIDPKADAGVSPLPRTPGLPDSAFRNDGQLTRREVRAATLAALMPYAGQRLWDVGAGCGSIAIEWMRAARHATAIAIERSPARSAIIAENAAALGVPRIGIVTGSAPAALAQLEAPDAVFIGGGLAAGTIAGPCWEALPRGGRLVANAVTVESEQVLATLHRDLGGDLVRIAVSHVRPVGGFSGWKPSMPVTQWRVIKP